ncbi:hypothetical protein DFQ28_003506 [Apophysomyces sp. BC1034]|nr:hypothetical protein DFQ28_003506 [Apophysomyces sp. BC1034]
MKKLVMGVVVAALATMAMHAFADSMESKHPSVQRVDALASIRGAQCDQGTVATDTNGRLMQLRARRNLSIPLNATNVLILQELTELAAAQHAATGRQQDSGKGKKDMTKENEDVIYVGNDDGFRQNKTVTSEGTKLSIPSLVRTGFTLTTIGDGDAGAGGYETEGRQFTVDAEVDGEDTRFDDYALTEINRVLVNHALHMAGLSGKKIVLATGLPFQSFFRAGSNEPNQELIHSKIANLKIPVSAISGQAAPVIVEQQVTAQGLAAYVDYLTGANGEIRSNVDPSAPVAVVDIGGRTTDTVTVYGGGKLDHEASGTGNIGISNVFDHIANELKREFNVARIRVATLDQVARHRKIRLRGQEHNVGEIVDAAVQEVGQQILREVKRRIGDAGEMDTVVLVGGGAALMHDLIRNEYPHCQVPDDPEFANARGMLNWGRYGRRFLLRLSLKRPEEVAVMDEYDRRSYLLGKDDKEFLKACLIAGYKVLSGKEIFYDDIELSDNESNNTKKEHQNRSRNESGEAEPVPQPASVAAEAARMPHQAEGQSGNAVLAKCHGNEATMKKIFALFLSALSTAAFAGFSVVEEPVKAAPVVQKAVATATVEGTPLTDGPVAATKKGEAGLGLVAVSYTGPADTSIEVRNGFGRDVKLADVLKQIAPVGWSIYKTDDLTERFDKKLVSWRGGRRWVEVLDVLANDQGLGVEVVWKKKQLYVEKKPYESAAAQRPSKPVQMAWVAKSGSTLRESVRDWAKKAGWELRWMPDDLDYPIIGNLTYDGTFESAITGIFRAYEKAERPMLVDGNPKQKVLVITEKSIQNINDTMKRGEDTAAQAAEIAADMQRQRAAQQRETVVFSEEPIVSLKPLRVARPKGPADTLNCNITFAPAMPMDILEFGQTITKLCGISVRVTPDALAAVNGQFAFSMSGNQGATPTSAAAVPAVGQQLPPLPALPGATGAMGARASGVSLAAAANLISNIKWNDKPVDDLLDVVTSRLGLSWRKEGGAVSVFYLDTKTFSVFAIPSQTDMNSVVQSGTMAAAGVQGASGGPGGTGGGGGISGTSGSTQTTSVTNKSSITADIVANISSMLTPNVGRMTRPASGGAAASGGFSTGTITVTDTPEVLARIETYLQGENKNITKQVLLNVKVLSVTLSDKDSLGIDWTLVYKSLNGNYEFGLKNLFQADSAAVNGAVSILDTATGRAGQFAGSSLIVQALSQQGRVSTITSPSVTTLNLQPVPVQVARQTSYLASVQTTNTAQVGSTTALTPGTVTTGFNMNLLPYVMPDNNLLLQYSINLSALQRLRSVTSGGSTIEIPEVDNRIFSQKVRLKSGETLVLSGFEQSIDNGNKQGVGNPNNILLGGGMGADNRRDVIVVLITPVVMD